MKIKHVTVTSHAHDRFRQRFVLKFPRSVFISRETTINFITAQLMNARLCFKWKQVPFYVNSITSKYGPIEVFEYSGVYYVCMIGNREKGSVRVLTTVPRFKGEYTLHI